MAWIEPVSLNSPHIDLVPLSLAHRADLAESVQDGELWNLWYTTIPNPDNMQAEIERRLHLQAEGSMLPFAVIDKAKQRAVGMTTYMHIDSANHRLEIGSTWYRKSAQRTSLNSQCKLLLLSHAFDTLACIAVEFRTHFFNRQSRQAIERLGAKLDGVLRQHQRSDDGGFRDTCVYSIIQAEWPAVRANLVHRLKPR